MKKSPTLHRLLAIRKLQEEQRSQALRIALADLHAGRIVVERNTHREQYGQRLLSSSVRVDDPVTKAVAESEIELARNAAPRLHERIRHLTDQADMHRSQQAVARTQRDQAESLVDQYEELKAAHESRRAQHLLDEWFRAQSLKRSR